MIRTPDPDDEPEQRQAATTASERAAAIAEAVSDAVNAAEYSFRGMPASRRKLFAMGAVGIALTLLEKLPAQAMETWLAYQKEGDQFVTDGQLASAAWSSRTAHVAISQIAEQGRMIATEAWPFIAWLHPTFFTTGPYKTEQNMRDVFGDAILVMPDWLDEMQI